MQNRSRSTLSVTLVLGAHPKWSQNRDDLVKGARTMNIGGDPLHRAFSCFVF